MSYLLFDLLFLGLPVALLVRRAGRLPARLAGATAVLTVVALAWTAPWDEHLVRTGVWSYDGARVLARLGTVPAEEYLFVVLEVVLIACWGHLLGRLTPCDDSRSSGAPRAIRVRGALAFLAVLALGAGLVLLGGQYRYLGLLLVWIAPPMSVQRLVAGDVLRRRRLDRAVLTLPIGLWLCVADRLALADGVWSIAPTSSTGVLLLGLPLEEAMFFVLTAVLVADGLLLATDDCALARVRTLLRRWPVRGPVAVLPVTPLPLAPATSRPSRPTSAPAGSAAVRTSP